jgi:hypothetical protein
LSQKDMNLVLKAGEAEPAMLARGAGDGAEITPAPKIPEPEELDMTKTVVIPRMPMAETVREAIDFGEETTQIPPLSQGKGRNGDTGAEPKGVYLGWTAWLGGPPQNKDLDQLFIQSEA